MITWWAPLLLAPFIGSFVGVLVRRLPAEQPILMGRSRCESCGHRLSPLELMPIASFFVWRGRCRECRARIAPMHLAVELAALAVAVSAVVFLSGPVLWAGCVLGWTLLPLAWIDAEHFWLPDVLTLPLLAAGLLATWFLAPWAVTDHALAAALGYGLFRCLAAVYRRWRGFEGLGQGDAKLLAAGGAWLGLAALPAVLLTAAGVGLAIALGMRLAGRTVGRTTRLPLGTALAVAVWAVWLAG